MLLSKARCVTVFPLLILSLSPITMPAQSRSGLQAGLSSPSRHGGRTETAAVGSYDSGSLGGLASQPTAVRRTRWLEGVLLGTAAGAAIGAATVLAKCGPQCGDNSRESFLLPVILVGGAGGGLLGAIIGSFVRTD